jgi:isoleucyl-tRNA synthetase
VLRKLEEARAAKLIGTSLEAFVTVTGTANQLKPLRDYEARSTVFPGNLANLFIVSRVVLEEDASLGDGAPHVEVARAPGRKCERCWTYSEKVGQLGVHPGVCERCAGVLEAGPEPRTPAGTREEK